jgi:hypothetical protein
MPLAGLRGPQPTMQNGYFHTLLIDPIAASSDFLY